MMRKIGAALAVTMTVLLGSATAAGQATDGAALFDQHCTACHRPDSGTRAPLPAVLREMPRESILRALNTGNMRDQGDQLNDAEKISIATYLGKAPPPNKERVTGFCSPPTPWVEKNPGWNG